MSKRKTYDEEFKKTLVNLILNGQSLKEVSREYGVSSSNLVLWRKKYSNINTQSDEVVTLDDFRKLQKELAAAKEECAILKKGFDNIREKLDDTKITDLIKQLKPKYSQEKMCKIFKISRATYYFNINKTTTKTQERYELLSSQIKRIYEENSKIYGAPKIHAILNRQGYPASIKLVQRIMRALGLSSITRKKYKPQTIKSKVEAPASNLLKQDFSTTSTNEKIVGDITYIYTKDFGWTYLASFMDLHTNEIKGWEYSTTMTTDIVLKALSKLNLNSDLTGCIIHTDQGSQYTSKDYVAKVKDLGATLSYSRKGNPYDNASIESFHSVLKKELIYQSKPKTFEETKKSLFKYIEGWYNNHRIQKKLGYLSPADYQKQVA